MRKPLAAFLVITTVLAAGGYSFLWHKKADEFKNALIASIASLNDKMRTEYKEDKFIQYQSVEAVGFPFAMRLEMHKPVIRVPVTGIMLASSSDEKSKNAAADMNWVEEITYGENVSIESNLIGSVFTLATNGPRTQKTLIKGELRKTVLAQSSTPLTCHLRTAPTGLVVMRPVFNDMQSVMDSIHGVDCTLSGLRIEDDQKSPVFSAESIHVAFTNSVKDIQRNASVTFLTTGTKYSPGMDALVAHYLRIFAQLNKETFVPFTYNFAELGKTDMNIDIAYNGPKDMEMLGLNGANADLNVKAFEMHSAYVDSSNKGTFTLRSVGDKRDAGITLASRISMTELYDKIMEKHIGDIVKLASGNQDSGTAPMPSLFPKLHALGEIAMDLDASWNTIVIMGEANAEDPFGPQGDAYLKKFSLTAAQHGFKMQGQVEHPKGAFPHGKLDITCLNCDATIDGVGGYLRNLFDQLNKLSNKPEAPVFSKELLEGIKRFMHAIAVNGGDANVKNLDIALVMKDASEITVSGKPISEVSQLYFTNIAPFMPAPPPPPAMPPEPQESAPDAGSELNATPIPPGQIPEATPQE